MVCCGVTCEQMNTYVTGALSAFNHPFFCSCDFSRFDSLQVGFYIDLENAFYRKFGLDEYVQGTYPLVGATMKQLLRMKKSIATYTPGLKFKTDGGRKTGDVDTCLGNTIFSIRFYVSFFIRFKLSYRLLVLGDDNFMILNAE